MKLFPGSRAAGRCTQWSIEPSHRVGAFYLGSNFVCTCNNIYIIYIIANCFCMCKHEKDDLAVRCSPSGMGVNEALSIVQKMGSTCLSRVMQTKHAWPGKHCKCAEISWKFWNFSSKVHSNFLRHFLAFWRFENMSSRSGLCRVQLWWVLPSRRLCWARGWASACHQYNSMQWMQ